MYRNGERVEIQTSPGSWQPATVAIRQDRLLVHTPTGDVFADPHPTKIRRPDAIPMPDADRVPVVRDAECRYCDRYGRPCGRHEVAAVVGSLVLNLDTDTIHAALAARDVALADRDRSQLAYENEDRRAGRYTRRYREAAEEYAHRLDLARADVERAVRAANPGAPEALIVATARNL